jgi:type II secretory pathway component PulF
MNGNGKITSEQFLRFNEQLLGLVRARVPLDHGLRQMAGEMTRGRLQNFTASVAEDLERGLQLSDALEKFRPNVADYYISLVRAGEKSGSLAEILHHIITETRRQIDHRRVLVTSLAYPAMVAVMAAAILWFICQMVTPRFVDIFSQLGADLPLLTRVVIKVFTAIVQHFIPLLILAALLIGGLAIFFRSLRLRPFRDAFLLHCPIIGSLVYNDIAISFCRSLGYLLTRGVTMTDALVLTQSVVRNFIARQFVGDVREGVLRGESLSVALEDHPYLPPSTHWMIRLSEERGDLDKTLLDIADFYQVKNEQIRRTIGGMVEPVIIFLLGLVIGTIVVSFYLPLFTIPRILR